MIAKSINKTEIKDKNFSFKKNNKKYKTFAKSIFFLSAFIFSGTFTSFINDTYKESQNIDKYEAYYNTFESYNNFKKAMDAVPYTDEMFNKDLAILKKIYGNKETRSAIGYNTYHFIYAKKMLNNDPKKVDKYISYFKGYDEKSFYKENAWEPQLKYVRSLYKNDEEMKINSITVSKTIGLGLTSKSIINNREIYLKENNIYKYTYGLNKKDAYSYSDQSKEEKRKFDENQSKEFYNFIDNASNADLRKMFKAINSYQVLIASQHFGLRKMLERRTNEGYLSNIYYENINPFNLIELIRYKYISNDEKKYNRYMSLY